MSNRTVEGLSRDDACRRYQRKVQLIARGIYGKLSPDATIQLDDLVSCGAIGLLEAYDRFDESRGIAFSTYAEYRIRGAVYDALRGQDTFSRRRRELARRIERATDQRKACVSLGSGPGEHVTDAVRESKDHEHGHVERDQGGGDDGGFACLPETGAGLDVGSCGLDAVGAVTADRHLM